jgi:hypothetical protein
MRKSWRVPLKRTLVVRTPASYWNGSFEVASAIF